MEQEDVEYIGRIENDRIIDKNDIVIFGAGKELSWLLCQMKVTGIKGKILCICDNNVLQQGKKINGITVVSPEYAFLQYNHAVYIVYNQFCMEICKQLISNGIERIHLIRR